MTLPDGAPPPPPPPPQPPSSPSLTVIERILPRTVQGRRRLQVTLLLGGASLAGYMVTCVAYPAPLLVRDHSVERVLGLPLEQARRELEEQGLKVDVATEEADPVVPAGHVVWQDPPPETIVPQSTTVRLVPSAGPAGVTVPDVVAFEVDQASTVLGAAGLRVGRVDTVASSAESGVVVATRPGAGGNRPPGGSVDLILSRGPATIRIPNVVGLAHEEARERLEDAGLRVGMVRERDDPADAGTVLEQRPGAGTLSARSGRVNLLISRGRP